MRGVRLDTGISSPVPQGPVTAGTAGRYLPAARTGPSPVPGPEPPPVVRDRSNPCVRTANPRAGPASKGVTVGEQRAARRADAPKGRSPRIGGAPRHRHTPVLLDRCLELLGP